MPVRILDESLINKIAAGEVVERPASVVKELVENALDAGACELRVALRAGGRNLVRVVDNGSGMDRTDAMMCLERHATSKIKTDDDLFRVETLGFRGEAIPSIASVSKFELTTRTPARDVGTKIRVEGGKLLDVTDAGCAPGTQIDVGSLFFNVPARRKFLRSADTELGHCVEAVTRELLIRPAIDFELTHDERTLLRCPVGDHRRRAVDLLGPHGEALVPVSFTRGTLSVEGLVSPVGVHRQSAQGSSYLYVNGRFVRDLVMRRAVTQAYAGIVPKDRYPVVVLRVTIPPHDVDVNVHPAKTEVRFVSPYELQNAIAEGLRAALQEFGIHRPVANEARYRPAGESASRQVALVGERTAAPGSVTAPGGMESTSSWASVETPAGAATRADAAASAPAPAGWGVSPMGRPPGEAAASRPATIVDAAVDEGREATPAREQVGGPREAAERPGVAPGQQAIDPSTLPHVSGPASMPRAPSAGSDPADARHALDPAPSVSASDPMVVSQVRPPVAPQRFLLPVPRFRDLAIIGQLARTYILCEGGGEMVIVDQHAAHERVTLTKLSRDPKNALGGSQRLLTPLVFDIGPARARVLAAAAESLNTSGLDISGLGGGTIAVHGVPAPLAGRDIRAIVTDMADDLVHGGDGHVPQGILDHVLATLACHTSVRAHQPLDEREMRALLHDLDEVDHAVCAHGRPVAIRIGVSELERRFHRT